MAKIVTGGYKASLSLPGPGGSRVNIDPVMGESETPEQKSARELKEFKEREQAKADIQSKKEAQGAPTVQAVYENLRGLKARLDKNKYSGEILPGVPDYGRLKGKFENVLAEQVPNHNPSLRTFNRVKEGFTGLMARTFGGEKGVMTDRDIARFVKFIPDYETTDDERDEQWSVIDDMYSNISTAMKIKEQNPNKLVQAEISPTGRVIVKVDGNVYNGSAQPIGKPIASIKEGTIQKNKKTGETRVFHSNKWVIK